MKQSLIQYLHESMDLVDPMAFRPTEAEREVLYRISISDTPQLAYDQVSTTYEMVTARDKLTNLGYIVDDEDGQLSLTQSGEELVDAQAISDGVDDNPTPLDIA